MLETEIFQVQVFQLPRTCCLNSLPTDLIFLASFKSKLQVCSRSPILYAEITVLDVNIRRTGFFATHGRRCGSVWTHHSKKRKKTHVYPSADRVGPRRPCNHGRDWRAGFHHGRVQQTRVIWGLFVLFYFVRIHVCGKLQVPNAYAYTGDCKHPGACI